MRSTPTFKCELLCQRLHVWVGVPRAGNRLNEWWDLSAEHTAHSCTKILMVVSLAVLYTYQHLEGTSLLRFGGETPPPQKKKTQFLGGMNCCNCSYNLSVALFFHLPANLLAPPKQKQKNNNKQTTKTKTHKQTKQQQQYLNHYELKIDWVKPNNPHLFSETCIFF